MVLIRILSNAVSMPNCCVALLIELCSHTLCFLSCFVVNVFVIEQLRRTTLPRPRMCLSGCNYGWVERTSSMRFSKPKLGLSLNVKYGTHCEEFIQRTGCLIAMSCCVHGVHVSHYHHSR